MSPEIYSYLYSKVLENGALDIYTESIYMKKNRPATKICIICEKEDLDKFIEILVTETSTFGIRYNKFNRFKLKREFVEINTQYGVVNVKLGYYKNKLIKATPEYEDCRKICENYGLTLNQFMNQIISIINKEFNINLLT